MTLRVALAGIAKSPNTPDMLIGICGISGSGKSHLFNDLAAGALKDSFSFFEKADEIGDLLDGDLSRFSELDEAERTTLWELAVDHIREKCAKDGKVGIVAGNFMPW